jgi:hypothetical protein
LCTGFWWGSLRERVLWGDPGVDGRIILGWILKKWDMGVRTGLAWLRTGRVVYRFLVGKPEGKSPLGRPRRRWGDNIRMDLEEVGYGCEDWIGLAQDRDRWRALVSAVRNRRVP